MNLIYIYIYFYGSPCKEPSINDVMLFRGIFDTLPSPLIVLLYVTSMHPSLLLVVQKYFAPSNPHLRHDVINVM